MDNREKMILRTVEAALGFKLYDWQIKYIFEGCGDCKPIPRRAGRTTAYILRLCLSKGEPIILDTLKKVRNVEDEHFTLRYTRIFAEELKKIYKRLEGFGIKLRPIFFDLVSARNFLNRRVNEQ